jgi:hypothetical protein
MEPTREQLLELLVQGQGLVGGARRRKSTRKRAVPPALKKWHAFRKKHPNLTIKQQSRLYKQQKRKKGRGMDDLEDEEDFQGFGMLGGAEPSSVSTKSSAWQTKNVKEINKYEKIGEIVMKAVKKHFPKDYAIARKRVLGFGIDLTDYVRFSKANAGDSGQKLRNAWNAQFTDVVDKTKDDAERLAAGADWLSPRENFYVNLGTAAYKLAMTEAGIRATELDELAP